MIGLTDLAGVPVERVRYSAYGVGRHTDVAWAAQKGNWNFDGQVGFEDMNGVLAAFSQQMLGAGPYDPDADFDADGLVGFTDFNKVLQFLGQSKARLAEGKISMQTVANTVGYAGYLYDPDVDMYLARRRWYDAGLGRWMSRDPIGYHDSMNLHQFVRSSPTQFGDPYGLETFSAPGQYLPSFFFRTMPHLESVQDWLNTHPMQSDNTLDYCYRKPFIFSDGTPLDLTLLRRLKKWRSGACGPCLSKEQDARLRSYYSTLQTIFGSSRGDVSMFSCWSGANADSLEFLTSFRDLGLMRPGQRVIGWDNPVSTPLKVPPIPILLPSAVPVPGTNPLVPMPLSIPIPFGGFHLLPGGYIYTGEPFSAYPSRVIITTNPAEDPPVTPAKTLPPNGFKTFVKDPPC